MNDKIKISTKINLESANCFKLLVGILSTFIICAIFDLNNLTALWIGGMFFILGGIIGIAKYKTIGFYLLSISLGFIVFSNSYKQNFINISVPIRGQHAVIFGEIKSILNRSIDKQRIIVEGNFLSKTLPATYNTTILLTIIGKSNLQIGDKIIADGYIRPPRENVFEYDFNEVAYNRSIGTDWVGYVNINKPS